MSNTWIEGQTARASVTTANHAGTLVDPGTLSLKVKSPAGVVTEHLYGGGVVLKDAVGTYHAEVLVDEAGVWLFRWTAGAPYAGACEDSILVAPSKVI